MGTTALFQIVPFCGPLVGAIWGIVIEIIGLAQTHRVSTAKAAFAVFLPLILAVTCCVVVLLVGIGLGAAGAASQGLR